MGITLLTSIELSKITATLSAYRPFIPAIRDLGQEPLKHFMMDLYDLNCRSFIAKYGSDEVLPVVSVECFMGSLDLWHLSKGLNLIRNNIEENTMAQEGIELTIADINSINLLSNITAAVNQIIVERHEEYRNASFLDHQLVPQLHTQAV